MIESLSKNLPTYSGSSFMPWDDEALALFLGEEGGGGEEGSCVSSKVTISRPTLATRSMSSMSWLCSSSIAS